MNDKCYEDRVSEFLDRLAYKGYYYGYKDINQEYRRRIRENLLLYGCVIVWVYPTSGSFSDGQRFMILDPKICTLVYGPNNKCYISVDWGSTGRGNIPMEHIEYMVMR